MTLNSIVVLATFFTGGAALVYDGTTNAVGDHVQRATLSLAPYRAATYSFESPFIASETFQCSLGQLANRSMPAPFIKSKLGTELVIYNPSATRQSVDVLCIGIGPPTSK